MSLQVAVPHPRHRLINKRQHKNSPVEFVEIQLDYFYDVFTFFLQVVRLLCFRRLR